jgi:Rps23 Pro-64 3,4-dihydroxylase Tpa1-like proline 4-hydroxylase
MDIVANDNVTVFMMTVFQIVVIFDKIVCFTYGEIEKYEKILSRVWASDSASKIESTFISLTFFISTEF